MKTVLFLLVVLGTNVIQGITGFAGTLLAMPPSMMLLGVEPAKAILNALGFAASLAIVWQDRKSVNINQLRRMVLFMTLGIVLGLLLLQLVRINFLLVVYGIFLLVFALFKLFSKGTGHVLSPALGVLILISAGVIHGMFISGGSLLVIYAVNALPEKKNFALPCPEFGWC